MLKVTDWKDANQRRERIGEVLTAIGLDNKGYKRPHELSGGEHQRLAIARALLAPRAIWPMNPQETWTPERPREFGALTPTRPRGPLCSWPPDHVTSSVIRAAFWNATADA